MLDQTDLVDTSQGVLAVPPLGAFRTFQVPIGDIAEVTGIDFGELGAADVLNMAAARPIGWRALERAGDIVL